jgi:hypothetical protein
VIVGAERAAGGRDPRVRSRGAVLDDAFQHWACDVTSIWCAGERRVSRTPPPTRGAAAGTARALRDPSRASHGEEEGSASGSRPASVRGLPVYHGRLRPRRW